MSLPPPADQRPILPMPAEPYQPIAASGLPPSSRSLPPGHKRTRVLLSCEPCRVSKQKCKCRIEHPYEPPYSAPLPLHLSPCRVIPPGTIHAVHRTSDPTCCLKISFFGAHPGSSFERHGTLQLTWLPSRRPRATMRKLYQKVSRGAVQICPSTREGQARAIHGCPSEAS